MADYTDDLPRPKRSLRGERGTRPLSPSDLPSSLGENSILSRGGNKEVEKPKNFDNGAQSYLSQIDVNEEEEETILETVNNSAAKAKVQAINVVNQRISTGTIKEESKQNIKQEVNKLKSEFQKVEEVVDETKEELAKIGNKLSQEASMVKAKALGLGIQAIEGILNAPKSLMQGVILGKKTTVKATPTTTAKPTQKLLPKKVVPKVKYADLLSKKVEFVAHDKTKLVEGLTGNLLEDVFMANAIADVRYCVKFVKDLPMATKGMYAAKPVQFIFDKVTADDINYFLYYVSKNTDSFSGQNYKFSEAFATWIIKKSHEI